MQNTESTDVTISAIMRITGLSRDRIRKSIAGLQPTNKQRGNPTYSLAEAVKAIIHTSETPRDREARLRGDILEARLKRIQGESLNRDECHFVYKEIIIGLRRCIEASSDLSRADQSRFAKYLKHEYSALWDKLRECRFPEAQPEGQNNEDDTDEE